MKKLFISVAGLGVFCFSFVIGMMIAIEIDPFSVDGTDINDRITVTIPPPALAQS